MYHSRPSQHGFTPLIILVIILVLAAAGLAGWKVLSKASTTPVVVTSPSPIPTPKVTTFDGCVALKDSVLTTAPAICTTKAGQKFVRNVEKKTALDITPWHIRLPLNGDISDAFFVLHDVTMVRLSSDQYEIALSSLHGCRSGFEPLEFQRAQPGDVHDGTSYSQADLEKLGRKVGDYYYFPVPQVSTACAMPADSLTEEAANLRSELQAAFNQALPY